MTTSRIDSHFLRRLLGVALCILAGIAWAGPSKHWTVVDIKGPGPGAGLYSSASAVALNNHGQVLVYSLGAAGIGDKSFLWDNGTLLDFGLVPGTPPSEEHRFVGIDVNDRGEVVGRFGANVWTWKDGAWTEHPEITVNALAMNKFGHILTEAGLVKDGLLTGLGSLGGASVTPAAINDRDQIVGHAQLSNGTTHAFLWDDGRMTDLTPGVASCGDPYSSAAMDVNQSGHVLGYRTDPCDGSSTYFLSHDRHLDPLPVATRTELYALNNRGDVIGETRNDDDTLECAFVLSHGRSTCLNELSEFTATGLSLLWLTDINDHGWVIGTASDARGVAHTALFIPSP